MKTGQSISELATSILADRSQLKDYVGDTSLMRIDPAVTTNDAVFSLLGTSDENRVRLAPTRLFHEQVADKTGIPQKYYDRMLAEAPELLATNVNKWFAKQPTKRMVRTIGGRARAFLSEGYRPLDNYDVATHILPTLAESGLEIVSAQVTETRLYIQATTARIGGEVKVGDAVQAGVVIRNSEVGKGSLAIEDLIWRLRCKNGAIGADVLRQAHFGGVRKSNVTFAEEIKFSDATQQIADKAFWAQARDAISQMLTQESFDKKLEKMRRAANIEIKEIQPSIELIADKYDLGVGEANRVLEALAKGGDLSLWGLANAVTFLAHDEADQDRAYDFEKIGAKIIELPASTFSGLN